MATESQAVKMSDGRSVDFPPRRKMQKEVVIENGVVNVRFDFVTGETRSFPVPSQHMLYAAGHGYSQKLGDWVAGLKDGDGGPADADDMLLEIEQLNERLSSSEDWNWAATGGSAGGGTIIIKALMEASSGKTIDQIKDAINEKLAKAEAAAAASGNKSSLTRHGLYASLRASVKLQPIIQRLEAEKMAKRKHLVDSDQLLEELT